MHCTRCAYNWKPKYRPGPLPCSFDCALALRGLRVLVHYESWTLKSCVYKEQLMRFPLSSMLSSVVPHLIPTKLVDCGPTLLTPYALLRKLSLVSSVHSKKINGTIRSIARQLQQKTPHTRKRSQLLR